jgi:pimeloyl-ACP methyl ester carboxylesterase
MNHLNRLGSLLSVALLAACSTAPDAPDLAAQRRAASDATILCSAGPVSFPLNVQVANGTTGPGAEYVIYVPEGWNGELVLYAHGYTDPARPVGLPSIPEYPELLTQLRDGLLCPIPGVKGSYALAVSSFSENGYAIKEGYQNTHQLSKLFTSYFGKPQETYVMGSSLGGLIAVMLAEKFPGQVGGALAMCGPVGGSLLQLEYVTHVRALFDFFYPGVIPGDAVNVPEGLDFATEVVPAVIAAVTDNPAGLQALALIDQTRLPYDPSQPPTLLQSLLAVLYYNIVGTNDLLSRTHGQVPVDTTRTRYSSPWLDPITLAAINAGVDRFRSSPAAVNYLRNYYQPTGKLRIPLVTLHTTLDPDVPFFHEAAFADIVAAAGASAYLKQLELERYGHCNFLPEEVLAAFLTLVGQVAALP